MPYFSSIEDPDKNQEAAIRSSDRTVSQSLQDSTARFKAIGAWASQ
jgi:hypothetical protein